MAPPRPARRSRLTARNADRHELYQRSVQAADDEVRFVDRVYRKVTGEKALALREDFCGTALFAAAWARSHKERTATGVDLSPEVLAWGREHNVEPLGAAAARVTLREQDVRDRVPGRFDVVAAFNYSYWVFRTRAAVLGYFQAARRGLAPGGIFLCDAYGGTEAQDELRERRHIGRGAIYEWHQESFNPIDHAVVNHIHFEFADGSRLERAFTYEWRFWTLPELTELLTEAGFSSVEVWWDRAAKESEERYRPSRVAENQPGWLAYLVARR